ncbi:MAG: hypothetical protein OXF41_09695 [bacterium]|nr:hypothetical protein [bacterium]
MATSTDHLASLVERADEAVRGIEDADRQRIAFDRVLVHLLNQDHKVSTASSSVTAPRDPGGSDDADATFADPQQRIDAVAEYFKIDPEQVPDVFDVSDEGPSLIVRTSQLDEAKANATREIALLVTGVRTALGRDTETAHIRECVDNYGRLDRSNFMKTLTTMPELSVLGKRGSSNRIVRMKVRGAEKAEDLVKRLVGE